MNARPTSLGLLLKVAAVIRDQPDRVKADFLNSLAEMDPLYKSELDYVLAYRWVEVAGEKGQGILYFYRYRVRIF